MAKKKQDTPVVEAPASRMKADAESRVSKEIGEKFGVTNPMAQPKLDKITINVNIGRHLDGTKVPANVKSTVIATLRTISGQQPVVIKAKKSVSNFKTREGYDSAVMVTIRRQKMWDFLDRLIHLATPRVKDFRGLNRKSFDGQGNYSMGLTEQGVFPEINMAEVNFTHGMNINFCFRNSNKQMSEFYLEQLGMPFSKEEEKKTKGRRAAS